MQVKQKVEEKVQAIGSELPIFVKEMTTTNIDGGSHTPGEMVRLNTLSTAANMDGVLLF
jgi:Ca2+-dependent lipid-binding protein